MPKMTVSVNESRVWRDLDNDTPRTVSWEGISEFVLQGFETFEVREFPFDRQLINLDLFHFVWRHHKDDATFEESMKVAMLTLETKSVLPEWQPFSACVIPQECNDAEPTYSKRFKVRLRIERKSAYYVIQVFFIAWMITIVSCFALAMDASDIGNRLALISAGLLTLIAFKYSIAESLPSVPYTTFTDRFLLGQVVTVCLVALENVIAFKLVRRHSVDEAEVNAAEEVLLIIVTIVWTSYLLYVALADKRRLSWGTVFRRQEDSHQRNEWDRPKLASKMS